MGLEEKEAKRGRGCLYINASGIQCRAFATKNSDRCIAHSDPNTRRSASNRMKTAHQQRLNPESVSDLLNGSSWNLRTVAMLMKLVMRDVHAERITPAVAHTLTSLGNVAIRALDKGELEERLEHLEKISRSEKG